MKSMSKRMVAGLVLASMVMGGCASRPDNIAAAHVSSSRYDDRTCKSLNREYDEVSLALAASSAKLDGKATQDAVVTGVALLLFWPAVFALGGNSGLESEVAKLKGEEHAIRSSMLAADCIAPVPAKYVPPVVNPIVSNVGGGNQK